MKRREFITLLGGAAAWPLAARAQPMPKMLRVGSVGVSNPRSGGLWAPIEQGLRELGYVEGQNLAIEYINLNGRIDGIGEAMQELVRRKVDVIVSLGNEIALKSALAATRTLPIVMVALDFDPFALGYVTSLARPPATSRAYSSSKLSFRPSVFNWRGMLFQKSAERRFSGTGSHPINGRRLGARGRYWA